MRASLVKEVQSLDRRFLAEEQHFLFPESGAHPTAADFAAYGILERLVGDEGDGDMGTATPWLFAEAKVPPNPNPDPNTNWMAKAKVPRLQAWHTRMRAGFPIRFLGKQGQCQAWGGPAQPGTSVTSDG